jgi:uncharacterized membrane protein YraQ (UPF0718 family)
MILVTIIKVLAWLTASVLIATIGYYLFLRTKYKVYNFILFCQCKIQARRTKNPELKRVLNQSARVFRDQMRD